MASTGRHTGNSRFGKDRFDSDEPAPVVLHRRPALSTFQSLALRAALVIALISVALLGHYIDRDGLKDNIDGHVSGIDIIYFTAVTITTVGYGDIVPVTHQARLFDTLVVTPVRIFVWLIFLGTAYTFVLRQTWERVRTRMIQRKLNGHIIICGFGAGGEFAGRELLRSGTAPDKIVVIDQDTARIAEATAMGLTGIAGDATHNAVLDAAGIATASSLLVSTSKDDAAALVVLSARQLNPSVHISAAVRAQENEDLLHQAGADFVLNPVRMGGHLLARSAEDHEAVNYLADLSSADGRVLLRERAATATETGVSLSAITTGMGLRILRDGRAIGYWEADARSIAPGDQIIEIVRVCPETDGAPA